MRPWCTGSRKAVAPFEPYAKPQPSANCPVCGLLVQLRGGCIPNHRERRCLYAGCENPQTGGGLCEMHAREIVGTEK
jgi:hypothetical protein